jgi:hypothetical protein
MQHIMKRAYRMRDTHHIFFPRDTTSSPACASNSWLSSNLNRCLGLSELSPDITANIYNRVKCEEMKEEDQD